MTTEREQGPSGYWKQRVGRQVAAMLVLMAGVLVFKAMGWPRPAEVVMGIFFFLQQVIEPGVPGQPATPLWRRVAMGVVFGTLGWWLLRSVA